MFSMTYKKEFATLIKLAYPILFAQLAMTGLGFLDTLMSGWVGRNDLAAIGLGSSIFLPVFMISTGILLAMTPIIGQLLGSEQQEKIAPALAQGLWLALPLGILCAVLLVKIEWILSFLQLTPEVHQLTEDYLNYVAWGLPGVALYQALRFFWEGLGHTLPTMYISFFALLLNIPLNALFIYGVPGWVEAYGAAGCGIATSLVMWSMLAVASIYVWRHPEMGHFLHKASRIRPSWRQGSQAILSIGVPNTLALLFEVGLFSFIALFVAKLGTLALASHQVAISYTSMAFMLPLSLSMAISVRTAYAYGKKDLEQLKVTLLTGLGASLIIGLLLAVVTYLFRYQLVAFYTSDAEVVQLAVLLLIFAALYQGSDALQAASAGILRGMGKTSYTMIVTFISYWIIGLGGGYLLAFTDWFLPALGVAGFWLGIVFGLSTAAIFLLWRVWQQFQRLKISTFE